MKLLYAVFDKKARAYGPIVSAAHDAVATRDFVAACSDGQSALSRFPEDFELHGVGEFQDSLFLGVKDGKDGLKAEHAQIGVVVFGGYPRVVITASAVKALNDAKEAPNAGA